MFPTPTHREKPLKHTNTVLKQTVLKKFVVQFKLYTTIVDPNICIYLVTLIGKLQ